MKRPLFSLLALGTVLSGLIPILSMAQDGAADAAPKQTIDHLSWMAGHWKGPYGGGSWEAIYTDPKGGMILGVDKELDARGRLTMFEFEKFFQRGDEVILIPHPNGKASVEFVLTDFDPAERKARFTNPEHDFPQVILFDGSQEDRLTAIVGNPQGGAIKGFELNMTRQP